MLEEEEEEEDRFSSHVYDYKYRARASEKLFGCSLMSFACPRLNLCLQRPFSKIVSPTVVLLPYWRDDAITP